MKHIIIEENDLYVDFQIRDNGIVELAHFAAGKPLAAAAEQDDALPAHFHPIVEIQETGKSSQDMHANKNILCSASLEYRYVSHSWCQAADVYIKESRIEERCAKESQAADVCIKESQIEDECAKECPTEDGSVKELVITLKSPEDVFAFYHMRFFKGIPVVQVWTVLENRGIVSHPIESVTSFVYQNLCGEGVKSYDEKTDLWIPHNTWDCETRWQKVDCNDVNLTAMVHGYHLPDVSRNLFRYGAESSWSSVEYVPMGMCSDRETGETYIFQLEHSGQWSIEYGTDFDHRLYVALCGPSEVEHGWWIDLKPGMTWETVPAAFGVAKNGIGAKLYAAQGEAGAEPYAAQGEAGAELYAGKGGTGADLHAAKREAGDFGRDAAIAAITRYRRAIRRPNADDEKLNIVFNDYMNCLMGDPYEENEKQIIDKAAELGCEYYCMDAGWYDEGYWWDRVGEWVESPKRFPNGLKSLFDYAHSKGLKMGLWLEIEVMGTACALADKLPDDWFVCRHGKRHVDNKRYLLDFRNPQVRAYCSGVIDRLITDYGCDYFKIDYNVTMGYGSELDTDSPSEAIRQHYEALYDWYRSIYEKYPDLVIENCGSGAMRMDYGMLKLQSLQSTSDQTDYLWNSYIGSSIASAVAPEQAGMWVYPYEDDREHVIYNFVNGLLLRPYLSGLVWNMSPENLALMKEGVALYKEIRADIKASVPFFPLGFNNTSKDRVVAYGLRNAHCAYLSVLTPFTDRAEIPLYPGLEIKNISVIYPKSVDCDFRLEDGILHVTMPQTSAGRLFRIDFEC